MSKSYNVNDLKFNNYNLVDFKKNYDITNYKLDTIIQVLNNSKVISKEYNTICFVIASICYNQDKYLVKDIATKLNVETNNLYLITELWCKNIVNIDVKD